MQARRLFAGLHKQTPEDSRVTYYLAITEAQLGRFQSAKKLYEEILALDPNGQAAELARQGLQYLPAETSLDLPPRFQGNASPPAPTSSNTPSASPQAAPPMSTPNGMSMQDWMALQMMLGQNGNASSGANPTAMMPWMMQQNPNNPTSGNPVYDPNVMSTMLMNQMLNNFSMESNKDDNR